MKKIAKTLITISVLMISLQALAAGTITITGSVHNNIQIQLIMAYPPENSNPATNILDLSALAPVTPMEATFDDVVPEKAPSMVSLAPNTPKEATFDDDDCFSEISTELLRDVAPVTPAEADFNDASPDVDIDISTLKFNTPLEADFSDF